MGAHPPPKAEVRGSNPLGCAIISALIEEGVIGDFRAPNILRFGFTPLYTLFKDVWLAVDKLKKILETKSWD